VITVLRRGGIEALAVATPLGGLRSDAAYVASLAHAVDGAVVLGAHGTGGTVITAVEPGANVAGLVYVAALAPAAGESAFTMLSGLEALSPTVATRGVELTVRRDRYRSLLAGDVALDEALTAAASQRPVLASALEEPAPAPAWASIPSYALIAGADKTIGTGNLRTMAKRAKAKIVEIKGSSHVAMISHPRETTDLIERAVKGR
jgi:pimeloyl-ACP methyl ester carboxylesterase